MNSENVIVASDFGVYLLGVINSHVINSKSSLQFKLFLPVITNATRFSPCDDILPISLDNVWNNVLDVLLQALFNMILVTFVQHS